MGAPPVLPEAWKIRPHFGWRLWGVGHCFSRLGGMQGEFALPAPEMCS